MPNGRGAGAPGGWAGLVLRRSAPASITPTVRHLAFVILSSFGFRVSSLARRQHAQFVRQREANALLANGARFNLRAMPAAEVVDAFFDDFLRGAGAGGNEHAVHAGEPGIVDFPRVVDQIGA